MRPNPLPEELYLYSRSAWHRSMVTGWLVGACLALVVVGIAAVPVMNEPGMSVASAVPRLAVLFVAVAGCVAWLSRSASPAPRLRVAADGITWQAGEMKRHVRWDEIRRVEMREDEHGRTVRLSLWTGQRWPMVIRGFEDMSAVRDRVRKGLAPDVPMRVRRTRRDWSRRKVFLWCTLVPMAALGITASVAWYLA